MKNFLKPDKRKIILTIVLFSIFRIPNLIEYMVDPITGTPGVYYRWTIVPFAGFLLLLGPFFGDYSSSPIKDIANNLKIALYILVLSYLLSCIIFWLYRVVKKSPNS